MKGLFYLIWFYNIIGVICQTNITSRLFPACSIVESTLYCFGGTTSFSKRYYNIINEHVALNLSTLNNQPSTTVSISSLQWKTLSNSISTTSSTLPPIMRGGTTTIHSNNSYLIYSGASTRNTIPNSIYNYHVTTNQWSTISLPTATNYTSDGSMVNLGNDTIWVWGGRSLTNDSSINSNVYGTFDYIHSSWSQAIANDWQMITGYSSTLAQNGIIYILGGYDDSNSILVNFNQIRLFNTQSSTWSSINSTSSKSPSNRMYHSVTNIPDKNLLFIYGGIFYNRTSSMMINDVTYVYDYVRNTFTSVTLPKSSSQNNNNRYGHFATILNQSNYLLLAFGFNDIDTGTTNSLNVLNVADVYNPTWVTQITASSSPTTSPSNSNVPNDNKQDGLSGGAIAGIVIAVVVVICIIGGIFFYLHKKRKQQQEENQKMMSKQDFLQRGLDDQYNNNNNNNNIHAYTLYNTTLPPIPQNRGISESICSSFENEKQSSQSIQQPTSPSPLYTITTNSNNNNNNNNSDHNSDHKSKGIKSYGAQLNYDMFNSSEFDFLHQQQQKQHEK